LFLVAACAQGTASPSASVGASAAPSSAASEGATACTSAQDVTIAYDTVSQGIWPLWIAKEQGILTKYGINANLIFIEGNRVSGAVISKQAPIVTIAGTDILPPVAQGADIKAILATMAIPTDIIVGGNGISQASDLKGKVAGANELGGESDSLLRLGLERLGLAPDKDVRVVAVGGESTRIAALKSGQVQATIVDVGLQQQMADQGFSTLYDLTSGDVKMLKNAIVTTATYISDHRDVVQCFTNAMVEAIAYEKAHKTESVDAAAKYSGDATRADLEKLWDIYSSKIPSNPIIDPEAFKTAQDLSQDDKVKAIDLNTVIDNSFVEQAVKTVAPSS
jgi:ABC-type nitrate/sulfonate/bicarbonate transport system substrate-binding protein